MERFERERKAEQDERAAEILRTRIEASGLPLPYRRGERTLETFRPESKRDRAALDACRALLASKEPFPLLLTGGVGTGKTHLAAATLREWIHARSHGLGLFTTHQDLLLRIRSTFHDNAVETQLDVINRYRTAAFLVLDDVGVEKPSEFAVSTLYAIVNHRYEEMLPTIVTSNLPPNKLAARLALDAADRVQAERVLDRIVFGETWLELDGPSHRGK